MTGGYRALKWVLREPQHWSFFVFITTHSGGYMISGRSVGHSLIPTNTIRAEGHPQLPAIYSTNMFQPMDVHPVRNNDPNGNVIKPQAQSHQRKRATVVRAVRFPCLVGRLPVVFRISSTQWTGWFRATFGSVPPGSLSVRNKIAGVMKVHAPKFMENGRFWPPYHDGLRTGFRVLRWWYSPNIANCWLVSLNMG
jgi:hypothetical protein